MVRSAGWFTVTTPGRGSWVHPACSAYWSGTYLFKNFALRDMAEFLEIYGLPARIAYYAQGTSDEDQDNILEALVNLGHEAVAALPQGNEIEFKEAASGGPEAFMSMVEWAERTTSKVILGSTLTSQADGKTSTNALGNVHNEVRHDILTADARQLSGMFSSLIQMMVQPQRLAGYPATPSAASGV